jgi:hypothetical protein
LALGSICSRFFYINQKVNKFWQSNSCVDLDIIHAHRWRFTKNNIFCVVCKQDIIGAKKDLQETLFLSFTKDTKNVGFPRNLTCTRRISRCTP